MATATKILERVKVREVAGVFRSRDVLDTAVSALLSSGFDRADIDVMVGAEARERVGGVKIAAEELPEVPAAPRQPVIAREDIVLVWSLVLSILIFAGAGFAAWLVVKSGEELIWAGIAAAVGAVAAGWLGAQLARALCTQAHQASRSSVDHPRARLAGARSLGRRRGEGRRKFCLAMARKRFARTRSRSTSAWSTCPCIRCGSTRGSATNLWPK